jgi:hypothetical protein
MFDHEWRFGLGFSPAQGQDLREPALSRPRICTFLIRHDISLQSNGHAIERRQDAYLLTGAPHAPSGHSIAPSVA